MCAEHLPAARANGTRVWIVFTRTLLAQPLSRTCGISATKPRSDAYSARFLKLDCMGEGYETPI
jgi:hypothetical protein